MSNLAVALHKKGFSVSGSDDEIYDPSKSKLEAYGLLPAQFGWDEANITSDFNQINLIAIV